MTAATRLESALYEAAEALMEVVGLPLNPADLRGPRIPVSGSLVSIDEVPQPAYRAATVALDPLYDILSAVRVDEESARDTFGDRAVDRAITRVLAEPGL